MKKEIKNTLVYDFIGTAFCLVMAFALILMFSGCSNDESVRPVGPTDPATKRGCSGSFSVYAAAADAATDAAAQAMRRT